VADLKIRMDPLNPGQFFACCGLLDLIDLEGPGALAHFTFDPARPRVAHLVVGADVSLRAVIAGLKSAKARFPDEGGKAPVAIRPAVVPYRGLEIELDWWLDEFREDTSNLKCWAGQVTTRNLFSELLSLLDEDSSGDDLFERPQMTKAKFGVDPRSAWNALDFGFSPNEHGADAATFPAVEILAAIGLQGFRPVVERRAGTYSLWQVPLPASVARLAFTDPWRGLPARTYEFSIAKRGQSYKYFTFATNSNKESASR
jgi:CRISPR-associated protein Csx14